jgi:putative spermidine/putrescine transport system ATP-binding protein
VEEAATIGTGQAGAPAAEVSVRLDGVSKHFGAFIAVDGVDLDVGRGEFFTLLGPSGSGKTTCLRMIAGFERPTGGRVLLNGEDVTARAPYERDVNTVFQDYALFPHMTVQENVEYGLRVKRVARPERRQRASEALARVRRRRSSACGSEGSAAAGRCSSPAASASASRSRARSSTAPASCSSTSRSARST